MHDATQDADEAEQRIARFTYTGDPAALWPGLTEPARVAASREIERVARAVLAGAPRAVLDGSGAHMARALGIASHTTGMGPLLGRWIENGRVACADDARDVFARHLSHRRARTVRIEREVMPALDALLAAGIPIGMLKGFHTGRAYFEEPGVRRMNDVLVPPERVAAAEAALRSVGFAPDGPVHRPYNRDWFGPNVDRRVFSVEHGDARSRRSLELHASLDRIHHPGTVARLDDMRGETVVLDVGSRSLRGLDAVPLLLTLAAHCSQELDGTRLLRLVELVYVVRSERAAGRLDWNDVRARALALGRRASTWAARHTVDRLAPAAGSLDDRGIVRPFMWIRGVVSVIQRLLRLAWPASFLRPRDVPTGWRIRVRRLQHGLLSLGAPDERH